MASFMRALAVSLALCFAPAALAHPTITVKDAYAFPSLSGSTSGIAFVTLTSRVDDALVGVATRAARKAEIHNHITENGVMQMRQVERVELPAGRAVQFGPGGLHLMLFDVAPPLKAGDTLSVSLRFMSADPLTLDIPVVER